jgi:hypothetical protein
MRGVERDLRSLTCALGIGAIALCVCAPAISAADLSFQSISERAIPVAPRTLGGAFKHLANGDVYFFSNEYRSIHRLSQSDNSISRIELSGTPEDSVGSVQLMQDFAVDGNGRFFVPAIWTYKERQGGSAGVLVFDSGGHYQRTVLLQPRTEVRHIALSDSGEIYVLGIDPAYFRHSTDSCFLVHRYTSNGARLAAFSACPTDVAPERRTSGPAWEALKRETDRGSIWIKNNIFYHLLPFSHQIRTFEVGTERPLDTVDMAPPDGAELQSDVVHTSRAFPSMIWRVVQFSDGRYLAHWSLASPDSANANRRLAVLTLHDGQGRLAVKSRQRPSFGGEPLWANEDGSVTFIVRQADGNAKLVRSAVRSE